MMTVKILMVLGVLTIGYIEGGGITGAFTMLMAFGVLMFVWYAITDGLHAADRYIKEPRKMDVTVYPGEAIKGTEYPDVEGRAWRENPDPTRPTDEDWAGLITYRIEKHNRSK